MSKQRIIKFLVKIVSTGLHLGRKVMLMLRPAAAGTGIVFTRVDLDPAVGIPAIANAIGDTRLAFVLQEDSARVSTAEHLTSACVGLDIDSLCIDADAEEIPIMDGSAVSFVFLLQSTGIEEQGITKRFARVMKPVETREDGKLTRLDPYFGFKLSFTIEFRHLAVDKIGQTFETGFADTNYTREIARVRTFGFAHEVEVLCEVGLARSGSLDNAIVLNEHRMLNSDGLRYGDELVRHKVSDATGDLHVMGHPLIAAYTAHKSGHGLDNALLRALLADETAYEMVAFDKVEEAPCAFLSQWQPAFS